MFCFSSLSAPTTRKSPWSLIFQNSIQQELLARRIHSEPSHQEGKPVSQVFLHCSNLHYLILISQPTVLRCCNIVENLCVFPDKKERYKDLPTQESQPPEPQQGISCQQYQQPFLIFRHTTLILHGNPSPVNHTHHAIVHNLRSPLFQQRRFSEFGRAFHMRFSCPFVNWRIIHILKSCILFLKPRKSSHTLLIHCPRNGSRQTLLVYPGHQPHQCQ